MALSKKRRVDHSEFGNEKLMGEQEIVRELYNGLKPCGTDVSSSCKMTESPFKVCTLNNILENEVASGLLNELQELDFTFKENDLLSLHQTVDLNDVSSPFISGTREFIYTKLKFFIQNVTGSTYNNTVDLHGIKFLKHNNLLCHSDWLETRDTAFMLYLVPKTWNTDFGGTLDLFGCDENDEPTSIECSLTPKFNTFSFFKVTQQSWHQVSEVLEDEIRWSISGWFHSDKKQMPLPKKLLLKRTVTEPSPKDVEVLQSWISLKYLNVEISSEIQQQFQDDSEVSLEQFLLPEKYAMLCEELSTMDWKETGPRNRQYYKTSDKSSKIVSEFMNLLKSDAFAIFLSHCTGLPLSKQYDDPDCKEFADNSFGILSLEVSRWEQGSYTLLRDQEIQDLPERLHIFYHADLYEDYDVNAGGYISFISHGDEEPLLVVPPQNNTLSIVFTRSDEFGFTKYINSQLHKPYYCFNGEYLPRTPLSEVNASSEAE